MESSQILPLICETKERAKATGFYEKITKPNLYNYAIGLDDLRTKIYITVEIRPDSLDNGSNLSDQALRQTRELGVKGDEPAQYIGKKLGGVGLPLNAFPLNPKVDTTAWHAAEDQVYNHLKQDGNLHARLQLGIQINQFFKDELSRPYRLHYYYELYENGQLAGHPIEGTVENTSPKLTNHDYYYDNYGRPRPYQGDFEFIPRLFCKIPSPYDD